MKFQYTALRNPAPRNLLAARQCGNPVGWDTGQAGRPAGMTTEAGMVDKHDPARGGNALNRRGRMRSSDRSSTALRSVKWRVTGQTGLLSRHEWSRRSDVSTPA